MTSSVSRINWLAFAGLIAVLLLAARIVSLLATKPSPISLWGLQIANGLVLGSLSAIVTFGDTLFNTILCMTNFAYARRESLLTPGYMFVILFAH